MPLPPMPQPASTGYELVRTDIQRFSLRADGNLLNEVEQLPFIKQTMALGSSEWTYRLNETYDPDECIAYIHAMLKERLAGGEETETPDAEAADSGANAPANKSAGGRKPGTKAKSDDAGDSE